MFVYRATNLINGKFYIGASTTTLKQRKSEHIRHAHNTNTDFAKDIIRYGDKNFKWEILKGAETEKELYELERYYISRYDAFKSEKGYNMTDGGKKGYRLLDRSKNYLYGDTNPSSRKIINLNNLKIYKCIEDLSRDIGYSSNSIRKSILDKTPLNNNYYDYYSEGKTYKKIYADISSTKSRKAVINIDTGEHFKTISQAARKYNCERYGIRECCNGKRNKFVGYSWKYDNIE